VRATLSNVVSAVELMPNKQCARFGKASEAAGPHPLPHAATRFPDVEFGAFPPPSAWKWVISRTTSEAQPSFLPPSRSNSDSESLQEKGAPLWLDRRSASRRTLFDRKNRLLQNMLPIDSAATDSGPSPWKIHREGVSPPSAAVPHGEGSGTPAT
jgi:hypothetical protein